MPYPGLALKFISWIVRCFIHPETLKLIVKSNRFVCWDFLKLIRLEQQCHFKSLVVLLRLLVISLLSYSDNLSACSISSEKYDERLSTQAFLRRMEASRKSSTSVQPKFSKSCCTSNVVESCLVVLSKTSPLTAVPCFIKSLDKQMSPFPKTSTNEWMCNTAREIEAATQPLSHSATFPEWLDQPLSHSVTLPEWLDQPLSHSATLPERLDQPLSHSATLSD